MRLPDLLCSWFLLSASAPLCQVPAPQPAAQTSTASSATNTAPGTIAPAAVQATPAGPTVQTPPIGVQTVGPASTVVATPTGVTLLDGKTFQVQAELKPPNANVYVTCQLIDSFGTLLGEGTTWSTSSPGTVQIIPRYAVSSAIGLLSAQCATQQLGAQSGFTSPSVKLNVDQSSSFKFSSQPEVLESVPAAGWKPSFPTTPQLESNIALSLEFIDSPNPVLQRIQLSQSGSTFTLKEAIPAANFKEGTPYRFHLTGAAGKNQFADSGSVFVVEKNLVEKLNQDIRLLSEDNGIHVVVQLTQLPTSLDALNLELPDLTPPLKIPANKQALGSDPKTFEFIIPTQLQNILQSLQSGSKSLPAPNDAQAKIETAGTASVSAGSTGQGTLAFKLVDTGLASDSQTIATLNMTVTKLSTALTNAAKQNPPGLDKNTANQVASLLTGLDPNEKGTSASDLSLALQKKGTRSNQAGNRRPTWTTVTGMLLGALAKGFGIVIP